MADNDSYWFITRVAAPIFLTVIIMSCIGLIFAQIFDCEYLSNWSKHLWKYDMSSVCKVQASDDSWHDPDSYISYEIDVKRKQIDELWKKWEDTHIYTLKKPPQMQRFPTINQVQI